MIVFLEAAYTVLFMFDFLAKQEEATLADLNVW